MITAVCLAIALFMPVLFALCVAGYAFAYRISVTIAFICVFRAWMEPL